MSYLYRIEAQGICIFVKNFIYIFEGKYNLAPPPPPPHPHPPPPPPHHHHHHPHHPHPPPPTPDHRWIPLTKGIDAELWCFVWSTPEQTVEKTIETPVIWYATAVIKTSLWCSRGQWVNHTWYKTCINPAFSRCVCLLASGGTILLRWYIGILMVSNYRQISNIRRTLVGN